MKGYTTIYYLLFVLLVMGSFASMAQNDYGIFIMGFVASGFSLFFLIQLFSYLATKGKGNLSAYVELGSLSLLAAILALRIFYIHFEFVELLFVGAGLLLIANYVKKSFSIWSNVENNKKLGWLAALFYGSIVFYIVSMITVPFWPFLSEPLGGIAFFFILIFIGLGLKKNIVLKDGDKISGLEYVSKFKDRSVILIFLFLLFTGYMGLTKIGVLPKMYSDEYPQAYFELVNRAESGKETPEDGKYKHQEFKEAYTRFIEGSSASK